jgi:hypothetical protein
MGSDPKSFRVGSLVKDCSRILVASGKILIAKARGIVDLALTNGSILTMYNVLYVPDLTHNLISVDDLQEMNIGVDFPPHDEGGGCRLTKEGEVIESFPRMKGLYSVGGGSRMIRSDNDVEQKVEQPSSTLVSAMAVLTLDDLHHRLGHSSEQKLLHMVDKNLLEGVKVKGRKLSNCFGCAMGKHKRHVMKTDIDKPSTKKLDLVHMDLMGPFRMKTRHGEQWVMTIIDDFSRFCWIFLLKTKTGKEVFDVFKKWARSVERESGEKLFRVRSDGGKEFKNRLMGQFCSENAYKQEFTNTDSPQQNGLSERQNWTLMSTMRSLLAASNLSEYWWGEALKAACYMRNRSSHSSLPNKISPLQAWCNRLPQLHKMHAFGCMVSVLNLEKELQDKLKPRGRMGKFLGYPEDTTGYKILLGSGKIVISSDVIFYDDTILKYNDHLFQGDIQVRDNLPDFPDTNPGRSQTVIQRNLDSSIPLPEIPVQNQSDQSENQPIEQDSDEEEDDCESNIERREEDPHDMSSTPKENAEPNSPATDFQKEVAEEEKSAQPVSEEASIEVHTDLHMPSPTNPLQIVNISPMGNAENNSLVPTHLRKGQGKKNLPNQKVRILHLMHRLNPTQ